MPNLSIKNVPEPVLEALRRRAADNHRSLQGELMAILTESLEPRARHAPRTTKPEGVSDERRRTIEEIAAARRAEREEPIESGPLAVDIIRAERDAR